METNTNSKQARTPFTCAASLASLVVNAPVAFLGSSNQLTSCSTKEISFSAGLVYETPSSRGAFRIEGSINKKGI
jgi:hypothetical protein